MKYRFNLKIQLIYGIVSFALSFLIIYIFVKQIDWLTPSVIGVFEFLVSGFYTQHHKKK